MRRKIHNAVLLTITASATLMFFLGAGSLESTGTGAWLSIVLMLVGGGWICLFAYANDSKRKTTRKEDFKMAIRGTRTIAEYAFRKWMERECFVTSEFELVVDGSEGIITDKNGDKLHLIYDSCDKSVNVLSY